MIVNLSGNERGCCGPLFETGRTYLDRYRAWFGARWTVWCATVS